MLKTVLMTAGLAAVFAVGVACFGFSSKAPAPATSACAGLEGQAKADCEKQQQR